MGSKRGDDTEILTREVFIERMLNLIRGAETAIRAARLSSKDVVCGSDMISMGRLEFKIRGYLERIERYERYLADREAGKAKNEPD